MRQAIRSKFSEALGRQVAGDVRPVIAALGDLADHRNLAPFVSLLLSDRQWLEEIASRSYLHANDFLKIVLMTGGPEDWKLRLHLWTPQPQEALRGLEDIHSHRWDFTTALVLGEYLATEYRLGSGDEHYHYEYGVVDETNSFSMRELGMDRLSAVFHARLPAGAIYHISSQLLHRVSRVSPEMTATLMVQGPAVRRSTDVYRICRVSDQVTNSIPVQRLTVDRLRAELSHFHSCLVASAPDAAAPDGVIDKDIAVKDAAAGNLAPR
jgi:hypothetical protein